MGRKSYAVPVKKNRFMIILKSRNISIQKLAENTGHTRPGVSRAINGEKMDPQMLDNIARYLDISPDFFTGKEPLKRIKTEQIEKYRYYVGDPDCSGYYVPNYSDYAVSRMKEVSANATVRALAPSYAMIRNAYIEIGKGIINPESREILSRINPDFVDENFNYLVPAAHSFMYQRAFSAMNQDEDFKQFMKEKEFNEFSEWENVETINSLFEEIPPDQEPDE